MDRIATSAAPEGLAVPTRKPLLSIGPSSTGATLNLRELWQYRDLLFALAARDVKLRYRQTLLGIAWVVLQPLLGAALFTVVFGWIARMPSGDMPYFLISYTGLLGWNVFNSTLTKASACVVSNAQLVSKVYFPRVILPLSTILSTVIDFLVGLAMLIVLLPLTGVHTGGYAVLLLPLWFLLAIMLAVGLGLATSAAMVRYRDLQYVVPVLLQFVLYATPVAYAAGAVPHNVRWFWMANPLSPVVEGFRWSLIGHGHVSLRSAAYSVVAAGIVLLLGALSFRKLERSFADVI